MIGKVLCIFCLLAVLFGAMSGNMEEVGAAVLDGAGAAVELTLTLTGTMCLWSGLCRVFRDAGLVERLAVLFRPLLKVAFPEAAASGVGAEEITANLSANLLGIGNAATPLALRAMGEMQRGRDRTGDAETASDDMISLVVLNSASISLIPTSILALRRQAGAVHPFSVVVPIWISSVCGFALAVVLLRVVRGRGK